MMLRARRTRRLVGVLAALALVCGLCALSGCGGDSGDDAGGEASATTRTAPAPTAPSGGGGRDRPGDVDPADIAVIRTWADALRRGDVTAAAQRFALPSAVANGTRPLELTTRAQVEAFNRSLPCGAVLLGTAPGERGLIVATFRLTERPGPGSCGSGTGHTAQTAFVVEDGLITHWLRVQDLPVTPGTPS